MVPVPDSAAAVNVMFSVAPSATESVSVSDESAIVPVEFVRFTAAPDDDARIVKSTDDDAFGIDSVYEVVPGLKAGESVPTLTDIESNDEDESSARAARPSAAATPPISTPDEATNTRLSEPL